SHLKRIATEAKRISYAAKCGNRYAGPAVVGGSWRVKVPNASDGNLFVTAAADYWRSGVEHSHFLSASAAIATCIGSLPGSCCIKCIAAVIGGISNGAENRQGDVGSED